MPSARKLERNDTHVRDVEQQDVLAREEMEGTPNKLAAFPQDLWVKSLLCLHWRDLLQFKQLRQAALVDGTSRAQYRAKLQILRDLQRHWRKLRLSPLLSSVLPLQHLFSVLPCGILAQRATPQSIELRLLPSHLRGRSSPEVWKVITVPDVSNVEGFCVDPVQDLLVVAERLNLPAEYGRIHIRSLELNGQRHPLSVGPPFLVDLAWPILVEGPLLGLCYPNSMYVFNWHTGRLVWLPHFKTPVDCCAFLDEQHVLVSETHKLCIYRLDSQIVCDVVDSTPGTFVCALHYPVLYDDITSRRTVIHRETRSYRPQDNVPFHTDRAVRKLFSLTMHVRRYTQKKRIFQILLPAVTIRDCIRHVTSGVLPRGIDWEDWGPNGTRMLEQPTGPAEAIVSVAVHASLSLSMYRVCGGEQPPIFRLFETNPILIARELQDRCVRKNTSTIKTPECAYILGPSTLEKPEDYLFKDMITTSWPYRLTEIQVPLGLGKIKKAMLMEDGIFVQRRFDVVYIMDVRYGRLSLVP
ncbi:predicted protein [Postia placenta Mad-698-R]|nr:predicted protein [Postia placenta Mad-698-R]